MYAIRSYYELVAGQAKQPFGRRLGAGQLLGQGAEQRRQLVGQLGRLVEADQGRRPATEVAVQLVGQQAVGQPLADGQPAVGHHQLQQIVPKLV